MYVNELNAKEVPFVDDSQFLANYQALKTTGAN